MGVLSSIGSEIKRSGGKFDKEVIRPYGREFERIPGLGDPTRTLHESRVAVRDTAREAREFRAEQSRDLEAERLRQGRTSGVLAAERARNRRIQMADTLVGQEVGIMSTTPIDGTNLEVNSIPILDPLDEMGNSIPEVV